MPDGPKRRVMRRPPASAASYDDEDDRPARPVRRVERTGEESTPVDMNLENYVQAGWTGANKVRKSMPSDWARRFEPGEKPKLIKFLQGGPFAVYKQHWCDWAPSKKKSFLCIGADECPICAIGDKPKYREVHNIVDFSDPEAPVNAAFTVAMRESRRLEELNSMTGGPEVPGPRQGPLVDPDNYYMVTKTGGGKNQGPPVVTIQFTKARDLEEDWGITPLDDDELADYEAKCFTMSQAVTASSLTELRQVAEAYTS